ncbi:nuclear receptor 2C2-associated protein-like isoform X1 [Ciona intestinalis]
MSLIESASNVRVSSVLNRDVKQYGKKYLFDNNEDTCWNSDQGDLQWIKIKLERSCQVELNLKLSVQFQGGFSSKHCHLELIYGGNIAATANCYPEDVNSMQTFNLKLSANSDLKLYDEVKINFKETTDFFGRVTIYCLDLTQL